MDLLTSQPGPDPLDGAALAQAQESVDILVAGSTDWQPAGAGLQMGKGDRVRTGTGSVAQLTFLDGSVANLDAETEGIARRLKPLPALDLTEPTSCGTTVPNKPYR